MQAATLRREEQVVVGDVAGDAADALATAGTHVVKGSKVRVLRKIKAKLVIVHVLLLHTVSVLTVLLVFYQVGVFARHFTDSLV